MPSYIHIKVEESRSTQCNSIGLTMDEVIWPKKSTNPASSYTVHCTRLQVNKQGPGDVFPTCEDNMMTHTYNVKAEP